MIKKIFSFGFITWSAILALAAAQGYQFFYNNKPQINRTEQQDLIQINQTLSEYDGRFQQIAQHSNQIVDSIKELDAYIHSDNKMNDVVLALNKIVSDIPSFPHKIQFSVNMAKPADATGMQSVWQEIKSLIRIRRHDEPITPYFSQDDVALVNENLSLILNQASFAAIRHYPDLYKNQIKQAQNWIKQYYDVNDPRVSHALETLSQLEMISVINDTQTESK